MDREPHRHKGHHFEQTLGDKGFQVVLGVENLPVNAGDPREPQVQSLGWECPLKEGMATHCKILA